MIGPDEDDDVCETCEESGNKCDCDRCNGEPTDDDIEENIKAREGYRVPWTGA